MQEVSMRVSAPACEGATAQCPTHLYPTAPDGGRGSPAPLLAQHSLCESSVTPGRGGVACSSSGTRPPSSPLFVEVMHGVACL